MNRYGECSTTANLSSDEQQNDLCQSFFATITTFIRSYKQGIEEYITQKEQASKKKTPVQPSEKKQSHYPRQPKQDSGMQPNDQLFDNFRKLQNKAADEVLNDFRIKETKRRSCETNATTAFSL